MIDKIAKKVAKKLKAKEADRIAKLKSGAGERE